MQGRRGVYPLELRERVVRLVAESRGHHDSGVGGDHVGSGQAWCRNGGDGAQAGAPTGIDAGAGAGVTSQESAEVRKLRAENRELQRAK
jgi:transposase